MVLTGLASGCAGLNQTVVHEVSWEPAVYLEASRARTGLFLQVEEVEGKRLLSVVERWECVEEATQRGVEVEERKPKDWVLGVGTVLAGAATATGIGLLGGALTSQAVGETREGGQSGTGQIVGTAIGIAGAFGQLLAYKKISQWLSEIRFRRERPVRQEVGRKVVCDQRPAQGVLRGAGLPPQGLELSPRAQAPEGFSPTEPGLTLDGASVEPVESVEPGEPTAPVEPGQPVAPDR